MRMMRLRTGQRKPAASTWGLAVAAVIVLVAYHNGFMTWWVILGSLVLAGLIDKAAGITEVEVPKDELKTKTRYVSEEDL